MRRTRPALVLLLLLLPMLLLLACSGCGGGGVDATYGRTRGASLNGTGGLAQLFRERGHTVRTAFRLNDELTAWADTIVRFAPYPGPPEIEEADWYQSWLAGSPRRRLIYVPQDFDAEPEYWSEVLARAPKDSPERFRKDASARRDASRFWYQRLPDPAKEPVGPEDWFAVEAAVGPPTTCPTLEGPWAEGIDPGAAALTLHQPIKPGPETLLLSCDGKPLAIEWSWSSGAGTLVVANGSFLLNEPLARHARRPLASRVVEWGGGSPRNVAFVESRHPEDARSSSPFASLFDGLSPLDSAFLHWLAFLLLLALSMAPILGRPRGLPSAGADRPVAHAEALGDLLERTRDAVSARELLESYRRWRHPSSSPTAPRSGRGIPGSRRAQ